MNSRRGGELRLDPITAADLPHIYRGLSDPRVIAYYGVSYDSLTACQAQMDWYVELTRTGRGAWHLVRDRRHRRGAARYPGGGDEQRWLWRLARQACGRTEQLSLISGCKE